jgi:hypothetical protein
MPFMQDLSRLLPTGGGQMLHHQLKPLQSNPARELFCSWQRTQPWAHTRELQRLEDAIVEACAGLPLALRITGAQLEGVSETVRWKVGGLRWRGSAKHVRLLWQGQGLAREHRDSPKTHRQTAFGLNICCLCAAVALPCL